MVSMNAVLVLRVLSFVCVVITFVVESFEPQGYVALDSRFEFYNKAIALSPMPQIWESDVDSTNTVSFHHFACRGDKLRVTYIEDETAVVGSSFMRIVDNYGVEVLKHTFGNEYDDHILEYTVASTYACNKFFFHVGCGGNNACSGWVTAHHISGLYEKASADFPGRELVTDDGGSGDDDDAVAGDDMSNGYVWETVENYEEYVSFTGSASFNYYTLCVTACEGDYLHLDGCQSAGDSYVRLFLGDVQVEENDNGVGCTGDLYESSELWYMVVDSGCDAYCFHMGCFGSHDCINKGTISIGRLPVPSQEPTLFPTAPTEQPSAVPTGQPVYPTSVPTVSPTTLFQNFVNFTTTVVFNNMDIALFENSSFVTAFLDSVALYMDGISGDDLKIAGVTRGGRRRMFEMETLSTSDVTVEIFVVYVAEEQSYGVDTTVVTSQFSSAVTDGSFVISLVSSTSLSNEVSVVAVTYSSPVISVGHTPRPSVSPTRFPSLEPTAPTAVPTSMPTAPTGVPTCAPTSPTSAPSSVPSSAPSLSPNEVVYVVASSTGFDAAWNTCVDLNAFVTNTNKHSCIVELPYIGDVPYTTTSQVAFTLPLWTIPALTLTIRGIAGPNGELPVLQGTTNHMISIEHPYQNLFNPVTLNIENVFITEFQGSTPAITAIYINLHVNNTIFSDNFGCISYTQEYATATLVVINSQFLSNFYDAGGGAIYGSGNSIGSSISISDSYFSGNGPQNSPGYGGAIRIVDSADVVTVTNCVFVENGSEDIMGEGGAIYFKGNSVGTINIVGSTLSRNSFYSGGALYINTQAQSPEISSSFFYNNSAFDGGAIEISAVQDFPFFISDSIFSGNVAVGIGGAINAVSDSITLSWTNVTFEENLSGTGLQDGGGGAIALKMGWSVGIFNCVFKNNLATVLDGGAISAASGLQYLEMVDTIMEGNRAKYGLGGAIYSEYVGYSNITYTTIRNNYGLKSGGAVYWGDVQFVFVKYSLFENNFGGSSGVFHVAKGTSVVFQGSTFTGNSALLGGGIYVDFQLSVVNIYDCTFTNNTAWRAVGGNTGGAGGAIYIRDMNSVVSLFNLTFINNTAYTDGGAVYLHDSNRNVFVSDALFAGNTAGGGEKFSSGGAIYIHDNNIEVTLERLTFVENTATHYGGGLFVNFNNDKLIFQNNTFIRNEVTALNGGGMYMSSGNSNVKLEYNVFSGNVASSSGGGLYVSTLNDNIVVSSSSFNDNRCGIDGGGAFMESSSNVDITICSFSANEASNGGAVYMKGSNFVNMASIEITRNVASGDGGGLYFDTKMASFTLANSSCSRNKAMGSGGCMYCGKWNSVLNFYDLVIADNQAGSDGGGMYVEMLNTNITFTSNQVTNNTAINGGALYSSQLNGWNISQTNFSSNVIRSLKSSIATGLGGAIHMGTQHHDIHLNNNHFKANGIKYCNMTAYLSPLVTPSLANPCDFLLEQYDCGAIYFGDDSSNIVVVENIFESNMAVGSGGAGCFSGVNGVHIVSNTFSGNHQVSVSPGEAIMGGGALHFDGCGGGINVSFNAFHHNYAGVFGSAIFSTSSYTIESHANAYSDNVVDGYGGTLFWLYVPQNGVNDVPNIVSSADVFTDNVAVYGSELATQGLYLNATSPVMKITEYASRHSLDIDVLDYYGNKVQGVMDGVEKFGITTEASIDATGIDGCDTKRSGYLLGQSTVVATDGTAHFDAIELSCMPQGNLTLNFEVVSATYSSAVLSGDAMNLMNKSAVSVDASIDVYFRPCVNGEYYSDGECFSCPVGTYSLQIDSVDYRLTECREAPANSNRSGTYANIITAFPGFWRVSNLSYTLMQCPFSTEACLAGSLVGDESCEVGYRGPMCGVCDENYYLESQTNVCARCPADNGIWNMVSLGLIALAGVIVVIFVATKFDFASLFLFEGEDAAEQILETDFCKSIGAFFGFCKEDEDAMVEEDGTDIEEGGIDEHGIELREADMPSALALESNVNSKAVLLGDETSMQISQKNSKEAVLAGQDNGNDGMSDVSDNSTVYSLTESHEVFSLSDSIMTKVKILISVFQVC